MINGICTINNLPNISDVQISCEILEKLGAKIKWNNPNEITIDTRNINTTQAPLDLTSKFRASYYIIGSMLGRKGEIEVGEKVKVLNIDGVKLIVEKEEN